MSCERWTVSWKSDDIISLIWRDLPILVSVDVELSAAPKCRMHRHAQLLWEMDTLTHRFRCTQRAVFLKNANNRETKKKKSMTNEVMKNKGLGCWLVWLVWSQKRSFKLRLWINLVASYARKREYNKKNTYNYNIYFKLSINVSSAAVILIHPIAGARVSRIVKTQQKNKAKATTTFGRI